MGLFWSLLYPIFMLAVYTFVFSVIFQARWAAEAGSRADFAISLFAGLIVHALLAEALLRSPSLILSNGNYVKKIVFPLEVLPVVVMGAALFHGGVNVLVLIGFYAVLHHTVHFTVLLLPFVIIPFVFVALGVSWFLSSVGVFVRDIAQIVGVITTALLFLSPIFYPVSALPEALRPYLLLNPLTFIIEQTRAVLIVGEGPNWPGLAIYAAAAAVAAWAGFAWFQKTRRGFADVL